jgi:hypothetical protein
MTNSIQGMTLAVPRLDRTLTNLSHNERCSISKIQYVIKLDKNSLSP